ncbi:hypothetical protein Micbo1qcDRAFT_206162 [Microdochium bolleyi]|uniref:BTB domain-containing protein n=1 Tax=Microdochium bolleyi TaxID=196109 RepID=A0A136IYL9_9PEZI|nr:hypothetical protein Micbo1qcDRAFT_206162 [Microdochium bolleyi]
MAPNSSNTEAYVISQFTGLPSQRDKKRDLDSASLEQPFSTSTSSHHAKRLHTSPHILDPHGDLTLRIIHHEATTATEETTPTATASTTTTSTATDVLVCSRTLARASRYFSALLYGRFRESQTHQNHSPSAPDSGGDSSSSSSIWTVRIEELDPEILLPILRFLHTTGGASSAQMRSLAGVEICAVVTVVDYLGCEPAFAGLLPAWRAAIQREVYHGSSGGEHHFAEVLLAAVYTGQADLARMILDRLQADVNKICRYREFSKTSGRTAKRVEDPLTYKDGTVVEIDPVLEDFFGIGQALKESRDALWLQEKRHKAQGLALYHALLAKWLPTASRQAGKRRMAVLQISRTEDAMETYITVPGTSDRFRRRSLQRVLCDALVTAGAADENFEPALHDSESLLTCFRKLRRLFQNDSLPLVAFPVQAMRDELAGIEKKFLVYVDRHNVFKMSDQLTGFLKSQKERYES